MLSWTWWGILSVAVIVVALGKLFHVWRKGKK